MMEVMAKKYRPEDLPGLMGKRVRTSELSNIVDTCMILLKSTLLDNQDVEGTLAYYGDGNSPEYDKFFESTEAITPVYNCSDDLNELVVYDE